MTEAITVWIMIPPADHDEILPEEPDDADPGWVRPERLLYSSFQPHVKTVQDVVDACIRVGLGLGAGQGPGWPIPASEPTILRLLDQLEMRDSYRDRPLCLNCGLPGDLNFVVEEWGERGVLCRRHVQQHQQEVEQRQREDAEITGGKGFLRFMIDQLQDVIDHPNGFLALLQQGTSRRGRRVRVTAKNAEYLRRAITLARREALRLDGKATYRTTAPYLAHIGVQAARALEDYTSKLERVPGYAWPDSYE